MSVYSKYAKILRNVLKNKFDKADEIAQSINWREGEGKGIEVEEVVTDKLTFYEARVILPPTFPNTVITKKLTAGTKRDAYILALQEATGCSNQEQLEKRLIGGSDGK